VKVLDFGLAKAIETAPSSPAELAHSPTLSAHATQLGMILGTAAYMAPEQARGKPVDKRADIWAFGVVLSELLTGKRLFHGDEISDVLAAVLRQEIDWSALPPDTPSRIRRLLARCLDRDPAPPARHRRARLALEEASAGVEVAIGPPPQMPALLPRWPILVAAAVAVPW
jgi:serine/threonine-protein kinase